MLTRFCRKGNIGTNFSSETLMYLFLEKNKISVYHKTGLFGNGVGASGWDSDILNEINTQGSELFFQLT